MKNMTEEELQQYFDAVMVKIGPELKRLRKERRDKFLQKSLEDMKKHGVPPERLLSDGWWHHIPDFDDTRSWLTGLYISPPLNSRVVVCKDHPFVEGWMRAEGVLAVVLSVQTPSVITLLDEKGKPILDKDKKEVRIPGIPRVEVAFSEDDYGAAFYLPADCLKVLEYEDDEDDEEAKYAEDDDSEEED